MPEESVRLEDDFEKELQLEIEEAKIEQKKSGEQVQEKKVDPRPGDVQDAGEGVEQQDAIDVKRRNLVPLDLDKFKLKELHKLCLLDNKSDGKNRSLSLNVVDTSGNQYHNRPLMVETMRLTLKNAREKKKAEGPINDHPEDDFGYTEWVDFFDKVTQEVKPIVFPNEKEIT